MKIENGASPNEQQPTPEKLKLELLKIYALIPPQFGLRNTRGMSKEELVRYEKELEEGELLPILGERHRSESKTLLRRKIGKLLSIARANTTRFYRQHVGEQFEFDYEFGVDRQNPNREDGAYYALGLDIPNGNSMFDPNLIPELETRAFKQALGSFVRFNGNLNTEEGNGLKNWKNAYVTQYKKEPLQIKD